MGGWGKYIYNIAQYSIFDLTLYIPSMTVYKLTSRFLAQNFNWWVVLWYINPCRLFNAKSDHQMQFSVIPNILVFWGFFLPMNGILTSTTSLTQSRPESNGNEEMSHIL